MPLIEDHAICVRTWDWSETSQTAVLLTVDHGMIRVLAKGSKRDRSAFSGGLELCTIGQMSAINRPNSDLALLTHWDLLEPMRGIRQGLMSYNAAMLGVDLIPRLIQDHDPHRAVYEALHSLLQLCSTNDTHDQVAQRHLVLSTLAWYQWTILVAVGAMPVVDQDVLTGEALTPSQVYGFSAQLGGVTQDPIIQNPGYQERSREIPEAVWRVRAETIEIMRLLEQSPSVSQFWGCSNEQVIRITRLLGAYIQERTGTEIAAMNWLFTLENS